MNRLLYIVYGAETYHQEAFFSIASALTRLRSTPGADIAIEVLTDNPAPYAALPVTITPVSSQTLQSWWAPHGYHFRAKHVALLQRLQGDEDRVVLIDTDTFFHQSPQTLFDKVRQGQLLCNRIGGRYGDRPDALLYRTLSAGLQARGLGGKEMPLLNSGVIGLCGADRSVLERSIELMDELFPHAQGAYTLEEFVLAVAADQAGLSLEECPDEIHHYWSRKDIFRAKVKAWIAKHGSAPCSDAAVADIPRVTDALPRPPQATRLMIKLRTCILPSTQRQFARELLYGCYPYSNEFDRACGPVWWEKAVNNLEQRAKNEAHEIAAWFQQDRFRHLLGGHLPMIEAHLRSRGILDQNPHAPAAAHIP